MSCSPAPPLSPHAIRLKGHSHMSGTRPVEWGQACGWSVSLTLDQSWSGHGLRCERMYRNVRVLHQLGPLRCRIKQSEGQTQCLAQ